MTALSAYERLESPGIWRASPDAQRQDVVVSLGEATLTFSGHNDRAVSHWSLPAIERINPGKRPALYRPGEDAAEMLELDDDAMIAAIKAVQNAIERRRPHPGRLRIGLTAAAVAFVAALTLFWLPGAMIDYTVSVVPDSKRAAIGETLLTNIRRVAGRPCNDRLGDQALTRLYHQLFNQRPGRLVILSGGVADADHLPGGIILANRSLVEDYEDPSVLAGFALAEDLRARERDPLLDLLRSSGLFASFRFLTTGELPPGTLDAYAEELLVTSKAALDTEKLLQRFREVGVSSAPYAFALDVSGESTLEMIEADPYPAPNAPALLDDSQWVSLQGICGE